MQTINGNNPETRHKLFTDLYKSAFAVVAKYIARMGGSFDEAKDVFQDTLVVYYEKSIAQPAHFSNDTGYLIGIAKNLWNKRYHQSNLHLPLTDVNIAYTEFENPSNNRLMRFLSTAGKKCMDMLTSFYYDGLSLQEIAGVFGYSGVRSATAQKYKCLEKVRETIKEKALVYDDFME